MHTWGKRLAISAILTSLVFSFVAPSFRVEGVEASSALPATIKDLASAYNENTVKRLGVEMDNPNWVTNILDSIFTGEGPTGLDRERGAKVLLTRFTTGKITSEMRVNAVKFDESPQGISCKEGTWGPTFECLYHELYANADELDVAMDGMLTRYSQLADQKNTIYTTSGTLSEAQVVTKFKDDVKAYEDYIRDEVFPNIILLKAGIQVLGVVAGTDDVKAVSNSIVDFVPRQKDLDYNHENRTLKQANRVHKRLDYLKTVQNGFGAGFKTDDSVYTSTDEVYADVKLLSDALLSPDVSTIASLADIEARQSKMMGAITTYDKKRGASSQSSDSRFARCGQASNGITNFGAAIGENITAALCSVVILIQNFSIATLETSLGMLGTVSGIQDLKTSAAIEDGFLVSLIPKEFTADFLEIALNPPPDAAVSTDPTIKAAGTFGIVLKNAHRVILNVLNGLLILLFIGIALSNILQIQVSMYSVQKLFGPIVIGFILATGSWFIVRGAVELAGAASGGILTQFKLTEDGGKGGQEASKNFLNAVKIVSSVGGDPNYSLTEASSGGEKRPSFSKVFQQGILNNFALAAAVVVFILTFLFMIRALFLSFLIPLAPFAFFASAVPPLKSVWGKWSKPFFQWLIMPIIAAFWIWLGFVWLSSVSIGNPGDSAVQAIIGYLFGMVCFTAAIKSSLSSLSGEAKMVMDKWQGMGKKAWGSTGGAALRDTGKFIGRGANTFALNRNLLGIPGLMNSIKQQDALAEQKNKNARDQYASRDTKGNRWRAARKAELESEAEVLAIKKKTMETEAKKEDVNYQRLQRGISKMTSYQEELEGFMKKEIKLRSDAIDILPGFMSKGRKSKRLAQMSEDYHKVKADSILKDEDLGNKAVKDYEEFESFVTSNEKYLGGVTKEGDKITGYAVNKVLAANNKLAALNKEVEKSDEENRMSEGSKFSRAAKLKSRSVYTIKRLAENNQGLSGNEADNLRDWLSHASSYYEEGVHKEMGQEYGRILSNLGDGDISPEQILQAQNDLNNIATSKDFKLARKVEMGLIKRVGAMEGMFLDKKAGEINAENDVQALKDYDTTAMVAILTGNAHQLTAKKADKAERAHLSMGKDMTSSKYNKRRVEQNAANIEALRYGSHDSIDQAQLAEARKKVDLAEEKLKEHLTKSIEKIRASGKGGKLGVPKGESENEYYQTFGGIDKLEADLKGGNFKIEDYIKTMASADGKAKSKFSQQWGDSKAADHLAMGESVTGMPANLRNGGAGENTTDYPEF